jgi:hypothetical protein
MTLSRLILFSALLCLSHTVQAQYGAFQLSAHYASYSRPDFDSYLQKVSADLRLKGTLTAQNQYGVGMGLLVHRGHSEFEFGMRYGRTRSAFEGDTLDYAVAAKTSDWSLFMGGNYFPANWFFVGANGGVNAFGGDLKADGSMPALQNGYLAPPPGDPKLFGSYSWLIRAQSGFVFPFLEDGYENGHTIRLYAFYQLTSSFNFFDNMEHQLTAYTGKKKTTENAYGVSLQITFGRE